MERKIQCTTRCLDSATVDLARTQLTSQDAVRVPYVCKITGRRELLVLISDALADTVIAQVDGIETRDAAVLSSALLETSLCECDLATLTALPESTALGSISSMVGSGLLEHRRVHGMNYYALANTPTASLLREQIEAVLS